MKTAAVGTASAIVLGLVAAGVVTNPGRVQYETFAVQRLTRYLQEEACPDLAAALNDSIPGSIDGLDTQCVQLIETSAMQRWLARSIADNTQRQNSLVFSVYTSELSVRGLVNELLPLPILGFIPLDLPTYNTATIGILGTFVVYDVDKN